MDELKKKERLLNELRRMTGLELTLPEKPGEDISKTVESLSALCESFKRTGTREAAVLSWITGACGEADFLAAASRFRMDPEKAHAVYLLRLEDPAGPEVMRVLRQVLADRPGVLIMPRADREIVIAQPLRKKDPGICRGTAEAVLSVLNTELFMDAEIAVSDIAEGLRLLPRAYGQAVFAMETGHIFMPDRKAYEFGGLGAGRLLAGQSAGILDDYIRETAGSGFDPETSHVFEGDILLTADCFLACDLNIAETARQLHVHRNTLLYRLELIRTETGLDIRRFEDAMKYRLMALVLRARRELPG